MLLDVDTFRFCVSVFFVGFFPSCLLLFSLFITEPTALSSEQTAPWPYGACLTLKASLLLSFFLFFFTSGVCSVEFKKEKNRVWAFFSIFALVECLFF